MIKHMRYWHKIEGLGISKRTKSWVVKMAYTTNVITRIPISKIKVYPIFNEKIGGTI